MTQKNYRTTKGRLLDGRALALKISNEIVGMMLAEAFVVTRSAGFHLHVNKLDGVLRPAGSDEAVNVDVVDGYVRKSWAI